MTYPHHLHPNFEEGLQNLSQEDQSRIRKKVQFLKENFDWNGSRFQTLRLKNGLHKEKVGRSENVYRLIYKFEADQLFFLAIFKRKNNDYDKVVNEIEAWYNKYFLEDVEALKAQQRSVHNEMQSLREPLPVPFDKMLQEVKNEKPMLSFFEAKNWRKTIRKHFNASSRIDTFLCDLKEANLASYDYKEYNHNSLIFGKEGHYILAAQLAQDETEQRVGYLLYAFGTKAEMKNYLAPFEEQLISFEEDSQAKKLDRLAVRAYGEEVLYSDELWEMIVPKQIQDFKENINLALSPEQEQLLRKFDFPLMIDGQAGSGKSTMLYYLYRNILKVYLEKPAQLSAEGWSLHIDPPLYLSYNKKLLKAAENTIRNLLRSSSEESMELEKKIKAEDFQRFFSSFRDLLVKIYRQASEDRQQYRAPKYVDFARFSQEYAADCKDASKVSAEVAWYIIRSYIKGYQKEILGEDDFNLISKKDRSIINEDLFKRVHQGPYKWYKRRAEELGLWDEQDLVREILSKGWYTDSSYSFLVCDESQDFSRLEINLLLRLSQFSNFNLEDVRQLPLIFAGDPFQAVNPTGFRWALLKGSLGNLLGEMQEQLSREHLSPPDIEPLHHNYRSSSSIIQLANIIQYKRRDFPASKDILPQTVYKDAEGSLAPSVYRFGEAEQEVNSALLKRLDATTFLLPFDRIEGVQLSELEESSIPMFKALGQAFGQEEGNNKPISNLETALSAKGLEYPNIILYGFGAYLAEQGLSLDLIIEQLNDEQQFKLNYFYNKLYVALTRAKDRLYIIDSQEGISALWSILQKGRKLLEENQENHKDWLNFEFEDRLIQLNTPAQELDHIEQKPLEIAEEHRQQAENADHKQIEANAYRKAVYFYNKALDNPEYNNVYKEISSQRDESEAKMLLAEGQYEAAAEKFKQMGNRKAVLEAYLCGCLLDNALKVAKQQNDKFWEKVLTFMLQPKERNLAVCLEQHIQNKLFFELDPLVYPKRQALLLEMQKQLLVFFQNQKDNNRFDRYALLARNIAQLEEEEISKKLQLHLANSYFQLKRYQEALEIWQNVDPKMESTEKLLAQVRTTKYAQEKVRILDRNVREPALLQELYRIWLLKGNIQYSEAQQRELIRLMIRKEERYITIIEARDIKQNIKLDILSLDTQINYRSKQQLALKRKLLDYYLEKELRLERLEAGKNLSWLIEILADHKQLDELLSDKLVLPLFTKIRGKKERAYLLPKFLHLVQERMALQKDPNAWRFNIEQEPIDPNLRGELLAGMRLWLEDLAIDKDWSNFAKYKEEVFDFFEWVQIRPYKKGRFGSPSDKFEEQLQAVNPNIKTYIRKRKEQFNKDLQRYKQSIKRNKDQDELNENKQGQTSAWENLFPIIIDPKQADFSPSLMHFEKQRLEAKWGNMKLKFYPKKLKISWSSPEGDVDLTVDWNQSPKLLSDDYDIEHKNDRYLAQEINFSLHIISTEVLELQAENKKLRFQLK
ncbi:hypothetical protein SapgrDRAFT_2956 [Saprospira grandis DSM 2844]|uniref:DNA 3'-5' helicase II n=1 Tax=Saprospira grandis DSM 2844 TaxID=694433 RepID=J1I729_9BACT|nr:hypothetical protein [Saprospira grandis]EJF54605.1 hypothetical protein SapgrDRAFT_2956 [Saprospira grandis DSM 2844]